MLRVPSLAIRSSRVSPWSRFESSPRGPVPRASPDWSVEEAAAGAKRQAWFQRLKDATQATYLLGNGHWFL